MRMQLSIQDPDLMVCYIHFIMQETLFIKRNVAIRAAALSLLSFLGLVKSYGFSNNFSLFLQLTAPSQIYPKLPLLSRHE